MKKESYLHVAQWIENLFNKFLEHKGSNIPSRSTNT